MDIYLSILLGVCMCGLEDSHRLNVLLRPHLFLAFGT